MPNIVLLGIVSLLIDMSTEMVYPIIPLYLTTALGATPLLVGVIEGLAESLSSLLKVGGGYISDRYHNKKLLAFCGYAGAVIYKIAILIASSWSGVLLARVIDRVGKGLRTAPRDCLIAESAPYQKMGGSFGLHKMLDMLGSAAGILIAYFLIAGSAIDYQKIFLLSIIPAVAGVLLIFFVTEKACPQKGKSPLKLNFRQLDKRLKAFLIAIFIFTLGNSSNAFLLLRAQYNGYDAKTVILLYFLFNITASLLAYPLGRLSDRVGRRALLVAGYACYGAVYLGFALCSGLTSMILLFFAYGVYTALTSGTERALVAEIAPPQLKGTMLGMYAALTGIALLPASVIAGLLWNKIGAAAPFYFGGSLGLAAALALLIILRLKTVKPETPPQAHLPQNG